MTPDTVALSGAFLAVVAPLLAGYVAKVARRRDRVGANLVVEAVALYAVVGLSILFTAVLVHVVIPGGDLFTLSGLVVLFLSPSVALWFGYRVGSTLDAPRDCGSTAALGAGIGHIVLVDVILLGTALIALLPGTPLPESLVSTSVLFEGGYGRRVGGVLLGFAPAATIAAASGYLRLA